MLDANGCTDGESGIRAAYELAEKYYIEGGNNRIILASDGDLNVGITDTDELVKLIEEKRESGIYLTTLGFGGDNLKDEKMEALADNVTIGSFFDYEPDCGYDVIIGNPPYSLALDFINKSLELLHPGGLLIFLLRTNFLESEKRFKWWQEHPLSGLYTLHKRPSFTGRGTDATSYSWFVWERGGPAA